jgi:hypothetical protein
MSQLLSPTSIANNAPHRTLFTSSAGLENAKQLVTAYKTGKVREMSPELWQAKKIIDSTLHPGMGDIWRSYQRWTDEVKILDSPSSCPFACRALCYPTWLSQLACSHQD